MSKGSRAVEGEGDEGRGPSHFMRTGRRQPVPRDKQHGAASTTKGTLLSDTEREKERAQETEKKQKREREREETEPVDTPIMAPLPAVQSIHSPSVVYGHQIPRRKNKRGRKVERERESETDNARG